VGRFGHHLCLVYAFVVMAMTSTALPADARTAEVHVVVSVDVQRSHPDRPPDEPIEPKPAVLELARDIVSMHPAFHGVTMRLVNSEVAPNPRAPADFLALVGRAVDDVVVVHLDYHLRIDAFRALGTAGIQGFVAVHSVAGRRQVASRSFKTVASYPGDVTKEEVLQTELAARGGGSMRPVEEIELGLLDTAVKRGLRAELTGALGAYSPASLPPASSESLQEGMRRMARFLSDAPDRRAEAIQVIEAFLRRYPEAGGRDELDAKLRRLRQAPAIVAGAEAQRQQERAAQRVTRTLTAGELAGLFDQLVGSVVEVRAFKFQPRFRRGVKS
jgi:hypothetical protein